MKKVMMAALLVTLMVCMGAPVYAGHGQRGMGKDRGHGRGMGGHAGEMGGHPLLTAPWERIVDLAEDVGITQEQLDSLSALRKRHREACGDLINDLHNYRSELREIMVTAESSEREKALELAEKINRAEGQVLKNNINAVFEIRSIFSTEQLDKLKEIVTERHEERRSERTGRRGRGGRGNRDN